MYDIDEIRYGLRHPSFAVRELNRLVTRDSTAGVDVFAQDWDTLVVLDACRYDCFADLCDIDGELRKERSRGSATRE